ncbi:Laccase-15 [Frankliniella fusca]|uniref:Laccase-15 n=1 Tax=Frankliniella fusca TaxID=407009 RepID=A0AAE1L823_9NEOP|nr:Laccase-15 [Frankliniella fusca]
MTCSCRVGGALLLRTTILIGLATVVTTIIYFTPVPNPYYASCERPCHELDWPMICRFRVSLEEYESLGPACGQCPANRSACSAAQCVPGDLTRRTLLTANRMLPGPALRVCENDIVVVDVVNRAPGQALAVHWGGQSPREFPHMDGAPQVTQCPVVPSTVFQYKFRASVAGTHLWSATGSPQAEAVFGPLVVRQSDARDPHRRLYDEDAHLLTVSVLGDALLVNGHGEHRVATPLERGRRYRVRLLHGGGTPGPAGRGGSGPLPGPVTVSVPGLALLVIAVDGQPVRPRGARALTLWPGERVDAVLSADQPPPAPTVTAYRLEVRSADGSELTEAVVDLPFREPEKRHRRAPHPSTPAPEPDDADVAAHLEATDLEGLAALPDALSQEAVDVRLYLPFDFQPVAGLRGDLSGPQPPAKPGSAPAPLGPADLPWPRAVPRMCNISLALPAAPLLTQPRDAEAHGAVGGAGAAVCRGDGRPAECPPHLHGREDYSCECAHVIRVPLGSTVELVLADQGGGDPGRAHVFKLHGHSFWVVGRGRGRGSEAWAGAGALQRGSWEALAEADREGRLLRRHLQHPVRKDVAVVPELGVCALRFVADNPGYWLLREQSFYRWSTGLGVILQVGEESDLPPIPSDFPKCGSFSGPEFLLM